MNVPFFQAQPKASGTGWVRSEVAAVSGLETFSTCPMPLTAIFNREIFADGHPDYWVLLDTTPGQDPTRGRQD